MYTSIEFAALFLAAVISLVSATLAQDKISESKPKHDGKIDVTFDKDKNITTVTLNELSILENESESLSLVIHYNFTGQKPIISQSYAFFVLIAVSKQRIAQVQPLVIIADGEVTRRTDMENHSLSNKGNRVVQPFFTAMPFKVLAEMAKANEVSFKFRGVEYELTTNNLKVIRDFINRITL